jgi:GAF domain-containing protein
VSRCEASIGEFPSELEQTIIVVVPDTFTMRLLDLLSATAAELVERLEADACAISRVIGDVLILVAESAPAGSTLQLGQGYLVPDYPRTQEVIATRAPYTLTLDDDVVDPAEAEVLRELGFTSLLMLPLDLGSDRWGLVEVYRSAPQPFSDDDVRTATTIVAEASTQAG